VEGWEMKAFEDYWNIEVKPYIYNPADKEVFEAGWRAALEWAKDEGICSGDSCVSSQFQVCGVKEVIEEELEDTG
jgi:hypothetical protein